MARHDLDFSKEFEEFRHFAPLEVGYSMCSLSSLDFSKESTTNLLL